MSGLVILMRGTCSVRAQETDGSCISTLSSQPHPQYKLRFFYGSSMEKASGDSMEGSAALKLKRDTSDGKNPALF